jgi:NADH-quinone oxidoreductase subunit L
MFRLIFLTFFGEPRYDPHHVHVHESPNNMLIPLIVLAVLSLAGGWMAAPKFVGGHDHFEQFLHPVFAHAEEVREQLPPRAHHDEEFKAMMLTMNGVAIGFLLAWWLYIRRPKMAEELAEKLAGPHRVLLHKYYVDELYDAVIVHPMQWISTNVLWKVVDTGMIDGTVNGAAHAARDLGDGLRHLQSGNGRTYASWLVLGAVAIMVLFLWMGH